MSVNRKFAEQCRGTKLALRETQSRDAIVVNGRRRTIGYVNVGKELWGQLLVDRFNAHDELVDLLEELIDIEGPQPAHVDWYHKVKATLAKVKG